MDSISRGIKECRDETNFIIKRVAVIPKMDNVDG